jgi:hypothetical protein
MSLSRGKRECWKFWIEAITATAVVVYTIVAGIQANAMLEANRQTKKALAETRRAADAAVKANQLAETNATQALASSRLDQRPWLGIKDMRLVTLETGKKVTASTLMTNTGKTIAKASKTFMTLKFSPVPLDIAKFAVSGGRPKPTPTPGVIFPGLEFALYTSSTAVADSESVEQIKAKRLLVYVFGELEYMDVFGQGHRTLYCGLYEPEQKVFEACRQYNDAD